MAPSPSPRRWTRNQALKKVGGLGGDAKKIATTLGDNENQHVDALTAMIKNLSGTPVKAPGVDFGKAFADEKSFLKTAQTPRGGHPLPAR